MEGKRKKGMENRRNPKMANIINVLIPNTQDMYDWAKPIATSFAAPFHFL
jgi:hypothetical protein